MTENQKPISDKKQNFAEIFPENKKVEKKDNSVPADKKIPEKPQPVVPNIPPAKGNNDQNPAKKTPEKKPVEHFVEKPAKKSAKQIFIGFMAFVLGLIALMYAFVLWSLMEGSLSNPLIEMLGMKPTELKMMFLNVTNSIFGVVSLIFVIATLVKFFQWMMTSSESVFKKMHLKKMGGYLGILALIVAIWMGLYWLISRAEANPMAKNATESMIITTPSNVIGLTAPTSVTFDIGKNLYKKIPAKFIRQIQWDLNNDDVFGDASGATITHRFLDKGNNNGRFLIKAKVFYHSTSSNEEKTYTDKREVIISNVAVSAIMNTNTDKGAVPLTVKFSAKDSVDPDGDIVQYEWDFDGDGEYEIRGADKVEVEHTFTKIGDTKVSLRVTGQNNDYAVTSKVITAIAAEEKIRAEITSQNTKFEGVAPLTIELDGKQSYTKTGTILKYEWKIKGENKSYIGRRLKRTFNIPGEYEVSLVVENQDGDRDEVTQKILVYEKRNVVITTSAKEDEQGNIAGIVPFEVEFSSNKSEIPRAVEWKWDFENDGIDDDFGQKVKHIFRKVGNYEVKLTIVDSEGHEYSAIKNVAVSDSGVIARISATPSAGEVPLSVEFDGSASTSSKGDIISYVWEFKDAAPISAGAKISREFRTIGVFPVKLTILTSEMEKAEKTIYISVRGKSLQAGFDATPMVGEAPLKVSFDPQKSTGNIREYYWDFGDGQESYINRPEHTFVQPGDYIVKLRITDERSLFSETEKKITVLEPQTEE